MSVLDDWNHKWFGMWQEYGPAWANCPSARSFVFPEVVADYDKIRLRHYLTTAQEIASTSRSSLPCPFTGDRIPGSLTFRTDGEWHWPDDLPDYIERFDVAIPTAWLRAIEARNYVPPRPIEQDAIEKLERPPTLPRQPAPRP